MNMIYFDHAATTKPLPEVLETFQKESLLHFGNASSMHAVGFEANKALDKAREDILNALGVMKTHQCLFVSGASEANNLAIKGIAFRYKNRGNTIIASEGEHPSVKVAFEQLASSFGFHVIFLPLTKEGHVDPSALKEAMSKDVILVSIMAVNNETGAISPIKELSSILKDYPKALFHVDATQGLGKCPLPFEDIDLLSFSAHKIGGLKGSGALIYRRKIDFLPLISGGMQEFGYRSGTPAEPLAVSTALAVKLALANQGKNIEKAKQINAYLRENLSKIEEVQINSPENGIPFVLNISLKKHRASVVIEALSEKEIYVSSVSSCSNKLDASSYVLASMGFDSFRCANSIRISFGGEDTIEEAEAFVTAFKTVLEETRPI